jgi:hypothetical protein
MEICALADVYAVFITNTDPGQDPYERLSVVLVHVLDLAIDAFLRKKVNRHERYRSCALLG